MQIQTLPFVKKAPPPAWTAGTIQTQAGPVYRVSPGWSRADTWGMIKSRVSAFRDFPPFVDNRGEGRKPDRSAAVRAYDMVGNSMRRAPLTWRKPITMVATINYSRESPGLSARFLAGNRFPRENIVQGFIDVAKNSDPHFPCRIPKELKHPGQPILEVILDYKGAPRARRKNGVPGSSTHLGGCQVEFCKLREVQELGVAWIKVRVLQKLRLML